MKIIGTVQGNAEQAKALVIGKDTVYVHTDIAPVEKSEKDTKDVEGLFSYTEIQYDKDEYIELMAKQNEQLGNDLTDTQLALCEIYETIGGAE